MYNAPKYSPSFKLSTRDIGTRPGSEVPESGPKTATFRRVYSHPAGLRLLVRAKCGTNIGRKQLIERAENVSLPTGSPVQIDWEPVGSNKVVFWAVVYAEKEVVDIDLAEKNGVYAPTGKRKSKRSTWTVQKLVFPSQKGQTCIEEKRLASSRDVRVAVLNLLNNASLNQFRTDPSQ